ncbi:glutathione S-transferase family protein [Luteimonas kalidii]|uniref:Glutathione S-transferase family protein n=1 Tax=Luteimonas kalidii TaxID=3042025 RepID=A0ABT6JXJ6_9GAMM|nr:glutathione S-transferase family protein [Luteimonas kalidii]MDH5835200.1 glutathione S-transferase family protein [Luteimonas kalidii]
MSHAPSDILYYSHNLNPRVAVAVARHLQAPVRYVRADPMGREREAFRPINPNTRVPILVEPDLTLWETDAIAMRLAARCDESFWPPARREEVMLWVSWSAHHFTSAGGVLYFEHIIVPRYFERAPDAAVVKAADADFREFAAILDETLAGRRWLVGDAPTYADFRVASALPFAAEARLPLEPFAHIRRWHAQLEEIDAWRDPFAGLD